MAKLFAEAPKDAVADYVASKPHGKDARRVWYLYEFLAGERLPLNDLTRGNYIDVLDPDEYYTSNGTPVARQRVRDNLLGDARFCPTIRRTASLRQFEASDLAERCRRIMEGYPDATAPPGAGLPIHEGVHVIF